MTDKKQISSDNEVNDLIEKVNEQRAKPKPHAKSIKELKERLRDEGEIWRDEHSDFNEKTGELKVKPVTPRAVADILKRTVLFAIIGKNEQDLEKAPLVFYDPGDGIYKKSERLIKELIYSVERTLTIRQAKEVFNYLLVDAKPKHPTDDKYLIVVGS